MTTRRHQPTAAGSARLVPRAESSLFGIELARKHRCAINLPLRAPAAAAAGGGSDDESAAEEDPLIEALRELLQRDGAPLGELIGAAWGAESPLYELCALVTEPGSFRQTLHADTPPAAACPLYAGFVALQARRRPPPLRPRNVCSTAVVRTSPVPRSAAF